MPIITPSGGGATAPTTREQLQGNNVNIANGGQNNLTFDSSSGTALLDLTFPAAPTVVTAGIYSVAVTVQGTGLTAGGWMRVILVLDQSGLTATQTSDAQSATGHTTVQQSVAQCLFIPAGGGVLLTVENHDGAAARNFFLANAIVQRIS